MSEMSVKLLRKMSEICLLMIISAPLSAKIRLITPRVVSRLVPVTIGIGIIRPSITNMYITAQALNEALTIVMVNGLCYNVCLVNKWTRDIEKELENYMKELLPEQQISRLFIKYLMNRDLAAFYR